MNKLVNVRLAAFALNNLGISFIQRRQDEQARQAFEDALTMLAAVVRSHEENTSDYILSSSIDTIMSKASSAILDITKDTCSSSFQIVAMDDIAQTVHKVTQEPCDTRLTTFIRMELEGTIFEIWEHEDPIVCTAVLLYNFASAYKLLATTKDITTTTTQRSKYLERALQIFEILLSLVDSKSASVATDVDGCGLEPLAFSILALHGLVVCSTMKNASEPFDGKYTKRLSALQEEFLAHEGLIKLFLDSSYRMAAAA